MSGLQSVQNNAARLITRKVNQCDFPPEGVVLVIRLTRITGPLSVTQGLKCGGDTERGHSARDNETAELAQKGNVRLA